MAAITRNVAVGDEFAGKPKKISWQRLWTFSGGPFAAEGWPKKNIHTDLEFAKGVGLSSVAASGTQCEGYLCDMMIELFGQKWLTNGELTQRFTKMVPEGDTVQIKAKVTSVEEVDGLRVGLEVWCENQNGDKVVTGTAKGIV